MISRSPFCLGQTNREDIENFDSGDEVLDGSPEGGGAVIRRNPIISYLPISQASRPRTQPAAPVYLGSDATRSGDAPDSHT